MGVIEFGVQVAESLLIGLLAPVLRQPFVCLLLDGGLEVGIFLLLPLARGFGL